MVYLSDLDGTLVAVKQLKLDKVAYVDHINEIKALWFVCYYSSFIPSEYYNSLHHPNIVLFMRYTSERYNPRIMYMGMICTILYLQRYDIKCLLPNCIYNLL